MRPLPTRARLNSASAPIHAGPLRATIFFLHASGKMAVARQGGWATHGAAERMKIETKELYESMHGADGVAGDVRGAMCEAVGVRPTHCAQ